MTQTTFTDNVEIQGSRDIEQLKVKGHSTQTEPLETWRNNAGDILAEVTATGEVKVGDLTLLDQTRDALIEAHHDGNTTPPSTRPKRGLHSLGRIVNAASETINWIVAELELSGTAGVSSLQKALRVKLSHEDTGDSQSAELRAGDFEAINQSGTSGTPVGQMTGVHIGLTNADGAHLEKAVALEIAIENGSGGVINNAYSIYSGDGAVHFGDFLELAQLSTPDPAPDNFIRLSAKSDNKLYTRDSLGNESEIGAGSGTDVPSPGTARNVLISDGTDWTSRALQDADGSSLWLSLNPATSARNTINTAVGNYALTIQGSSLTANDYFRILDATNATLFTVSGNITHLASNSYSNSTVGTILRLRNHVQPGYGTPAAGFGSLVEFLADTNGGTDDQLMFIRSWWTDATRATRKAKADFILLDAGGQRTTLTMAASGSAPQIGVLGASPVVKQTVTGERFGNPGLASFLTAMANFGFITDSTTDSQSANTVLAAPNGSNGAPTFRSLVNGDLPVVDQSHGGTGQSTYSAGDILIADDSGNLVKLAKGSDGQVLTVDASGNPDLKWATPAASGSPFGDGHDGDVTVSTTITLSRDMYYNNLTITGSGVLKPNGYRIFVRGKLQIQSGGSISVNGSNGGNGGNGTGSGGTGGAVAYSSGGTLSAPTAGGNGIGITSNGTSNSASQAAPSSILDAGSSPLWLRAGGGGVGGGGHGGGASGNRTPTAPNCGAIGGNGGAGGGSGTSAIRGGGAGAGGGAIHAYVSEIDNAGQITASGGNGGNGATVGSEASGNGGGGGGGSIVVFYRTTSGSGVGTLQANGGTAGTGGLGGTTGATGYTNSFQI